jgi:D-amino-acid dehydrogenase
MAARSAIVLGAGMVGVSTALHLRRRGWSVALIDRRGPGEETSYGNAGMIQSEAVEPYPMPRDLPTLGRMALGRTNDVRYTPGAFPDQVGPLARYWAASAPERHAEISKSYGALIERAIPEHAPLIAESGMEHSIRKEGYLDLHRDPATLEAGAADARRVHAQWGTPYRVLDAAQVAAEEPALREAVAGAVHWTGPWTCRDPGGLTKAYEGLFERDGGVFAQGDANTLRRAGNGWSVETQDGPLDAEHVVVALGPWSPGLLERFGYDFQMVRKRGYHRHFRGGAAIRRPFLDVSNGYFVAPMALGLRITTGAELTGLDAPATPVQIERAEKAARALFDLGEAVEPTPWFGTRPFLPEMLPVIGPSAEHPGLWLHFGHGHQGFTLGPATGNLIAGMMNGEEAPLDMTPYAPPPAKAG